MASMKPRKFTYNQIITFFVENKLPLSREQVSLIASHVREEMERLDYFRKKEQEKRDKQWLKRMKRKESRGKKVENSGSNQPVEKT